MNKRLLVVFCGLFSLVRVAYAGEQIPQNLNISQDSFTPSSVSSFPNLSAWNYKKNNIQFKKFVISDTDHLYFSPNGKTAIVFSKLDNHIIFYSADNMSPVYRLSLQCKGEKHLDFAGPEGKYAIVSCGESANILKIDMKTFKVLANLSLKKTISKGNDVVISSIPPDIIIKEEGKFELKPKTRHVTTITRIESFPQDVRLSNDGKVIYIADMMQDGIIMLSPNDFKQIGFIKTGIGARRLIPSQDGKRLYVSNYGCHDFSCKNSSSVSVIDQQKNSVIASWKVPNGTNPGYGRVSSDGRELWLSYDKELYVFDTKTGKLTRKVNINDASAVVYWARPLNYFLGYAIIK